MQETEETPVQSLGQEGFPGLTPVFMLRESHGQRSLVGHSPWVYKELDTAEAT